MIIEILKSKIHRAHVTHADINYVGSIGIDEDLMESANIIEYEKVHVLNINNGERFVTYAIKAPRGSGIISVNGAAARKVAIGDIIIIISYCSLEVNEAKQYKPQAVFPDTENRIK